MPNVRQFLKAGEAEYYQNVQVEFIPKRPPILTIYSSGKEEVTVNLADYDTSLEDLHKLMQSKGFAKKSSDDIQEIKNSKGVQFQEDLERQRIMRERPKPQRSQHPSEL